MRHQSPPVEGFSRFPTPTLPSYEHCLALLTTQTPTQTAAQLPHPLSHHPRHTLGSWDGRTPPPSAPQTRWTSRQKRTSQRRTSRVPARLRGWRSNVRSSTEWPPSATATRCDAEARDVRVRLDRAVHAYARSRARSRSRPVSLGVSECSEWVTVDVPFDQGLRDDAAVSKMAGCKIKIAK